jgi:hypothetical protein
VKDLSRREALGTLAVALGASAVRPSLADSSKEKAGPSSKAVRAFYDSLSEQQCKQTCFSWDHKGQSKLPLRLHVTNNWAVSPAAVRSFSKEQQGLIESIFDSVLEEGWPEKLHKQAKDDTGKHWTEDRKVAVFGKPGSGRCQVVVSGFHLTLRAVDGPADGAAFGGAICHGHQPSGFNEKAGHPGNVFWYQAQAAHKVYKLLDGKQQTKALLTKGMPYYEFDGKIDRRVILPDSKLAQPLEPDVRFRGAKADLPGLPVADMTRDQKAEMHKVLDAFLSPYRKAYRERALACLQKQGGLEKCHLIFYKERTLGKEGEWDNWRVEGPAFEWYFRGYPHVHVWIHVSDDPATAVTSHFG